MSETILVAIIAGMLGAIPGIIIGLIAFKKAKPEIKKTNAETDNEKAQEEKTRVEAITLMGQNYTECVTKVAKLESELTSVKNEMDTVKRSFDEWKRGTRLLIKQFSKLRITPDWIPPED